MKQFSATYKKTRFAYLIALLAGTLWGGFAAALTPPPSYVLDPTGAQQTLEAAGILNANGRAWAIVLGKALFWDQQSGSDGNACASCHFHAGADTRLKNQLNPGTKDLTQGPNGDTFFGSDRSDTGTVAHGSMPSGAVAGANYTLTAADLPLHQLLNPLDRNSPIVTTTNDRVSSQGAFAATFKSVLPLGLKDVCSKADASVFHVGTLAARQVEPRNTPSAINAAFFLRTFWDNRANQMFNGVGPFGMRDINGDPSQRLIVLNSSNQPQLGYVQIEDATLASQAVAPVTSVQEMSCAGRSFPDVGRKLLFTVPLLPQQVSKTDSVLGSYASSGATGLSLSNLYVSLIQKAFNKNYWGAPGRFKIVNGALTSNSSGYAQIEQNFSLFWGISIMLYEQSLIADQSDIDSFVAAGRLTVNPSFVPGNIPGAAGSCATPTADVDPLVVRGCTIFMRATGIPGANGIPAKGLDGIPGGNCFICHNGAGGGLGHASPPLLSQGAFQAGDAFALFIQVPNQAGAPHTHDQGTNNIGTRPTFTDLMAGATDPYGNPLSYARQYFNYLNNGTPVVDPVLQRAIAATVPGAPAAFHPLGGGPGFTAGAPNPTTTFALLGVDGASKIPILRNVALTPPYFSWGGYPNLRQVMKTYNRGLNVRNIAPNPALEAPLGTACVTGDNSGTGFDGNQTRAQLGTQTDCGTNVTGTVGQLGMTDCDDPSFAAFCSANSLTSANDDLAAMVAFLKSLTDKRVQCDLAPFDHPGITLLNGHTTKDLNKDGKADDITFTLPAVGAAGYATTSGYCIPNAGDIFAPGMQARSGGVKVPL